MSEPDHAPIIGSCPIGDAHPPYVVAELGVNHDGDVDQAMHLVDAAANAGADAVKLQYFEARRLVGRACALAAYQHAAGESDSMSMLSRLELDDGEAARIIAHARASGLDVVMTVFSVELVERAEALGCDAYKTASPDIINRPLIETLARTGRPLIVSTGASEAYEVSRAIGWCAGAHDRLCLLQCVSSYPTLRDHAALGGIAALARLFEGPVGYSDHTTDEDTGALAVRLGASVLEKHLTLDRSAPGPDHAASLAPDEFARYVALVRDVHAQRGEQARPLADLACERRIGPIEKRVLPIEKDVRASSRQSLTTTRGIAPGDVLTRADVTIKRPGAGIQPWRLACVIGRAATRAIDIDMPITWDDLEGQAAEAPDADEAHAAA